MADDITTLRAQLTLETQGLRAGVTAANKELNLLVAQSRKAGEEMRQTGGGFRNVEVTAQQAAFAVDDFFAGFATGGVAGGLRGAGNNLTFIASQLGGIQTQLVVIGALVAAQFAAKWIAGMQQSEDATKKLQERMQRLRASREFALTQIGEEAGQRGALRDIAGITALDAAHSRQVQTVEKLAELSEEVAQAELQRKTQLERIDFLLDEERAITQSAFGELKDTDAIMEQITAEREELDKVDQKINKTQREINRQLEQQKALSEQILMLHEQDLRQQFEADNQALREARANAAAVPGFGPGDFEGAHRRAQLEAAKELAQRAAHISLQREMRLPAATLSGTGGGASVLSRSISRGLPQGMSSPIAAAQRQIEEEQLKETRLMRQALEFIRDKFEEDEGTQPLDF